MTKKDEEILTQLEAIMEELKEARQQSASTIAMERKPFTLGHYLKAGLRLWSIKISVILILLVLIGTIIGASIFYFTSSSVHTEKGSFVEQIRDLSSLATSQAYVKAVIEKEDNQLFGKEISTNIPGTKRKLLLIIPGSVTAGVDLEQLQDDDIKLMEEEKRLEITLPKAELLQDPSLDFEQAQTFSVEGIFRGEVNWDEGYELAKEAKDKVVEEALTQGLLQTAEKNAEKMLTEFYSRVGYDVVIHFQD
ncbi:DUF4230 domain-containing protein [Cytobacillus sp. FJAT-54145]|uniref:DUF4230 domain-containing protein n=1 Tax=Cytobacillus spartinae TaxID=3299023 RepID=A0ABW6KGA6_9BACI